MGGKKKYDEMGKRARTRLEKKGLGWDGKRKNKNEMEKRAKMRWEKKGLGWDRKKDYDKIGKRARMRWDYQGIMINFRKTTVERTLVYGRLWEIGLIWQSGFFSGKFPLCLWVCNGVNGSRMGRKRKGRELEIGKPVENENRIENRKIEYCDYRRET